MHNILLVLLIGLVLSGQQVYAQEFVTAQSSNQTAVSGSVKDAGSTTEKMSNDLIAKDKPKQSEPTHPLMLSNAIGYKLLTFKNIYIPPGDNVIFINRGEIITANMLSSPFACTGLIKIKLVQPDGPKGLIIPTNTEWTIERVNQNLFIVNDPAIEYIELVGMPRDQYLVDLFNKFGNVVQMRNSAGSVVNGNSFLPVNERGVPFPQIPNKCEMSLGEVYVHDFPQEFVDEFAREFPLLPNSRNGIGNHYAMKKFPYANWYYWVSGVLQSLYDIWQVQRSNPEPGKVVSLGRNYINTPGATNEIPWKNDDTEYNSLAKAVWPMGKVELKITIADSGKVSAEVVDSQFTNNVSIVLMNSIKKLNNHPSIIFPNVFPEKLFSDERNLALHEQQLYMGVRSLPEFKSITFNCTFRNSEIRK